MEEAKEKEREERREGERKTQFKILSPTWLVLYQIAQSDF